MTRARTHLVFGAISMVLVATRLGLQWRLGQIRQTEALIAAARADDTADASAEVKLARALALSRADRFEAAVQIYKDLIQTQRGPLRDVAEFNEANLLLRESLKNGADFAIDQLPLIEIAKQSYRNLLRRDANHWDARYNLDRALWLAPEFDEPPVSNEDASDQRERAITTMHGFSRDLP